MLALLRMLDNSSLQDTTLLNSLPGTKLLDSKKLLLLFWSPKIGFRYLRSVFLIFRPKFYLRWQRTITIVFKRRTISAFLQPYIVIPTIIIPPHDLLAIEGKFQLYMVSLKVVHEWKPFQHEQHYLKDEFIRSFQAWRTATIFLSFCLHIAMLFYASSSVTNIQCPVFL